VRIFILFLLLFNLHAAFADDGSGVPVFGAIATNPASGATLVQTAGLNSGSAAGTPSANWQVYVYATSTAAASTVLEIELMNGASVVGNPLYFTVPATGSAMVSPPMSFNIQNGFTLRVITSAAVTGNVQANIITALKTVN
jgi:hypothetical protein